MIMGFMSVMVGAVIGMVFGFAMGAYFMAWQVWGKTNSGANRMTMEQRVAEIIKDKPDATFAYMGNCAVAIFEPVDGPTVKVWNKLIAEGQ